MNPQLNQQLSIDQLPDLCLRHIFTRLGLQDLARCRAVCRLFKFYADRAGPVDLVVASFYDHLEKKWYQTDKPVDYNDSIELSKFASLKPSQFGLNQRLKFLCVFMRSSVDFDTDTLNGFEQLVHLEFDWSGLFQKPTKSFELRLRNLRTLSLGNLVYDRLVLKTPLLEVLQLETIATVQIEQPESIKKLCCQYENAAVLAKFKNVELFRCGWISEPLDSDLLSVWKNLKELDLDLELSIIDYNQLRSSLMQILNQRTALRREGLNIYLNNIRLIGAGQLENHDRMQNREKFQIKNYKFIREGFRFDLYLFEVNYNNLLNLVGGEISGEFFEKFPDIQIVVVSGVVDPDRFSWFLKNARDLTDLILADFTNTSLNQEFLDSLPSVAARLHQLEIRGASNSLINFDFIFQLKVLINFRTDRQLEQPLVLAAKAFRSIALFHLFEFGSRLYERVCIRKELSSDEMRFELVLNGETENDNMTWTELQALFEQKMSLV